MDKVIEVIKVIKKDEFTYKLGYNLYDNKVYPRIEIYKDGELLSGGYWSLGAIAGLFSFFATDSSSFTNGHVDSMKEMFNKLRQYNEIPKYIENEYEKIFLLYKLNDFKEVRED